MTQTAIPYVFMRGGTSRGPYFRRSDLPEDLETLADVLAAADVVVRILAAVSRGADLRETILDEAPAWISAAKLRKWEAAPDRIVIGGILSSACYIPDAFPAALFLAYRHAGRPADGICSNAQCGGDSCHRGSVVGSLLGATAQLLFSPKLCG